MDRYHVRRAAQAARLSKFEEQSLLTGPLLLLAAVVLAALNDSAGGPARALALIGLGVLGLCATVRGLRLYRAGAAGSMRHRSRGSACGFARGGSQPRRRPDSRWCSRPRRAW